MAASPCRWKWHDWGDVRKTSLFPISVKTYVEDRTCQRCGSKQIRIVTLLPLHQETTDWLYYS